MESSWNFINKLDAYEKHLLSSAIDLSGLPTLEIAGDNSRFVKLIRLLTGCTSYNSLLSWSINESKVYSISELEIKFLNSVCNSVSSLEEKPTNDIIQKAFNILDIRGYSWSKDVLDEVFLTSSDAINGRFIYGYDIRYSLQHSSKSEYLNEKRKYLADSQPMWQIFLFLLRLTFVRRVNANYIRNKIIPIVCALIIIRNEQSYVFENETSCLNFLFGYIEGKEGDSHQYIAAQLLSEENRFSIISHKKWEKVLPYIEKIRAVLVERVKDSGDNVHIEWDYTIPNHLIEENILAKRRHAFMHAISDDIKGVIEKLKRDCNKYAELKSCKGEEILSLHEYYTQWRQEVKCIPLDSSLTEVELNNNIKTIVRRGKELLSKTSPFFHSLVNQYAYLFPGYQDSNNEAYRRLTNFIRVEDVLEKQISDFSDTRTYEPIINIPAVNVIELVKSSLDNVTRYVEYKSEYNYDKDTIKLSLHDFHEYVVKNFESNLKEKAFYKKENGKKKIILSVQSNQNKLAIIISNNGEPFNGDVNRVFEEHYSYGENRGNGQGLYDAKQYVNYIGGDIQLDTYPLMEYPVRFIIILPII